MFRKMSRKASRSKMFVKDQEEQDKQENKLENLDPNKVLPDITLLINERDYLKDEVRTLREHLENENVRYTELKSLKHQQVGALTFKLAKAIRDKERALEEKEEIHKKCIILQHDHEELKFQHSILSERFSASGRDQHHHGSGIRKRAVSVPKMSYFAVTGVKSPPSNNNNINANMQENPIGFGGETSQEDDTTPKEQTQAAETKEVTAHEHKDAVELESPSSTVDDGNKSLLAEFHKIQEELSDVKKNMSIVQALNERLSGELDSLEEIKRKPEFTRSISERSRKNACSSLSDFVDGKKEPTRKFVFPDVGTEQSQLQNQGDNVERTETANLERKEEEFAPASSQAAEKETGKCEMVGEHQEAKARLDVNAENSPKHGEMDFRKQLEKAMKELEEIRNDNRVMKHQIDQMAVSSLDHNSFLRRTTDFTGQILKEMKEREDQRSRKTSVESQPPLNILGTRLDEIMKAVEDMTYEPQITPKPSPVVVASRPHSSSTPVDPLALTPIVPPQEAQQEKSKEASSVNQKRRNIHGKLSEASLYDRRGLTSGLAGLRKISEPLPREWRSTEALSFNPSSTSLKNSLGYRDYIQRHIVMSSSAIAKIRDLTPEELTHGEQQRFVY